MEYICTKCSYVGLPKRVNGGSNLVSIALWTIIPTLYMLWEFHGIGGQAMQDPLAALQEIQKSNGVGLDPVDVGLTFPGPVYSIWRRIKKRNGCLQCGKKVVALTVGGANKKNIKAIDDDISPDALKKIPFRWAKDVEEYNKKHGIVTNIVPEKHEVLENKEVTKQPEVIKPAPEKVNDVQQHKQNIPQEHARKTEGNGDEW